MTYDLPRLLRELEAEVATREIMATKESDVIDRNAHIHVAGLLRRAMKALRERPDAPKSRKKKVQ